MTQHWLYPVNDNNQDKQLSDGNREIPRTPDGVRASFRSGTIHRWILGSAFHQVVQGDRLWIYASRPWQKITAVTNVLDAPSHDTDGTWRVQLNLDWTVTNYLRANPIPRSAFGQVPYSVTRANPATMRLLMRCQRMARTATL
jgi:hypothetical protein